MFCNIILAYTYLTTLSNIQSELKIHLGLVLEILNTKLIEDVWNQQMLLSVQVQHFITVGISVFPREV